MKLVSSCLIGLCATWRAKDNAHSKLMELLQAMRRDGMTLLIATHAAPANAGELGDIVSSGGDGSSIAAIVLTAVLAGWLRVTADLWRAVFNRVRTWNLFRA